ncbi:MAG: hypothetical protein H7Y17_04470, partial [Chlorobia bacterium]|nr:hypothetical protein [Fimbriimonadaceae bacterium]
KRVLDAPILNLLGGAPAIVNNHLKRTLEESTGDDGRIVFPPSELELIARLSLHLVTIDLAKIAHSAASLAEFVEQPVGKIESILTKLERLRILRRIPVHGIADLDRFEIAHDMLGKAIVNWRPSYLKKTELSRQWDHIRQKTLKWSLVAAVVALGILGVLLVLAVKAQKAERMARTDAETQRTLALEENAEAKRQYERAQAESEAVQTLASELRSQAREESTKREQLGNKLQQVTKVIDGFLEKHPDYKNELQDATEKIDQAVEKLQNPRIATLDPGAPIRAARYSPDGRYIAIGSENKLLSLWSRSGGKPLAKTFGSFSKGGVSSLAFSPTQGFILTGSAGSSIRLFDPRRSELGTGLEVGQQNSVNFIAFSDNGRFSVSLDDDRRAILRDWGDYPKRVPTVPAAIWQHSGAVTFADFSSDSTRVVTSCDDGMVRIFEISGSAGLLKVSVNGSINNPLDVKAPTRKFRFSPTDPDLVVGGAGYSKVVWFYLSGNRKALYQDHTKSEAERGPFVHGSRAAVLDVSFRPNGTHVVSIGTDGLCLIWDTSTARTVASIHTEIGGRLLDVEWGSNDLLALAGEDGWIELWNMSYPSAPGKVFSTKAYKCSAWSIQFDPLKEQLLTYGEDIRYLKDSITAPSGRASEWKLQPGFQTTDYTAAIWDIGLARRKGWTPHSPDSTQ